MRAETALWCALLVVLVAALPAAAVDTAGGDGVPATAGVQETAQPTVSPAPTDDRTVHLDVQLLATGDADWTVRTYVPLEGPNESESFRELGRRYENGTADLDVDVHLFERYVAAARSASGRAMWIDDASVERSWRIENGTGVLVLAFTWTNFAREEGDRLVVGDAFASGDGTWLPRLEAGQVLVIRPPEGVGFIEAPKRVTDATLRWEGPREFDEDDFHIVYRAGGGTSPTVTTAPPGTTPPDDTPTPEPAPGMGTILVGVLVVGTGIGYLLLRRRPGGADEPSPAGTADDGAPPSVGTAAVSSPSTAPAPEDRDAGAWIDEDAEPTPEDPFAGIDVAMLSDEERVLRLLESNDGRMRQARIVKETDWSNAKVSQLLSSMDDDGEIDKLRIGRENLISLPDVTVDRFQE